jgi:hypothetical protein
VGQAPNTVPAVVASDPAERWSPAPPPRFRKSNIEDIPPDASDHSGPRASADPVRGAETPSGTSGPETSPPTEGHAGAFNGGLWVDDDPVVAEFFSTPPPFFIPAGQRGDEEAAPPKKPSKLPKAPGRSGTSR